jgi:rhodanese-related sulfurtransferase
MANEIKISSILRKVAVKNAVLIDVLEPESFKKVHLKGAVNIPFHKLEKEIHGKVDPDTPVITYSKDYFCPISKLAAEKLEKMGYKKVSYYKGGKKEWLEVGMPTEK